MNSNLMAARLQKRFAALPEGITPRLASSEEVTLRSSQLVNLSPGRSRGFLGLVPSEYSSVAIGAREALPGRATDTPGRVSIEAAWSYRFPARKTAHLRRKASSASRKVQAVARTAQKRLCARYRHLYHAGMEA